QEAGPEQHPLVGRRRTHVRRQTRQGARPPVRDLTAALAVRLACAVAARLWCVAHAPAPRPHVQGATEPTRRPVPPPLPQETSWYRLAYAPVAVTMGTVVSP